MQLLDPSFEGLQFALAAESLAGAPFHHTAAYQPGGLQHLSLQGHDTHPVSGAAKGFQRTLPVGTQGQIPYYLL